MDRECRGVDDRLKPRPPRPPRQAVPAVIDDEITGKYEGPELVEHRSRRTTARRLEILEGKHDELAADVSTIRTDTAATRGTVDALFKMTAAAEEARQAREKADQERRVADMTFAAAQADAKRQSVPALVKAIGIAVAVIVAAALGHYGV